MLEIKIPEQQTQYCFSYHEPLDVTHLKFVDQLGLTKEVKHYILPGDKTLDLQSILYGNIAFLEGMPNSKTVPEMMLELKQERGEGFISELLRTEIENFVLEHRVAFFNETISSGFHCIKDNKIPYLTLEINFLSITNYLYTEKNRFVKQSRVIEIISLIIQDRLTFLNALIATKYDSYSLKLRARVVQKIVDSLSTYLKKKNYHTLTSGWEFEKVTTPEKNKNKTWFKFW